ncbi:MAG: DDE-type integrase/transposase/recombinase [Actinomycetota bacterium]
MGGVCLTNGIQLSVVTGIDDHSRFCVIAKVVARATARPVCEALLEALNTYGIPEQILTDNGKVFTGHLVLARSLVDQQRVRAFAVHPLDAPGEVLAAPLGQSAATRLCLGRAPQPHPALVYIDVPNADVRDLRGPCRGLG